MEGCGNFRIIYSEETIEFLNRLEEKAKAKEIRRIFPGSRLTLDLRVKSQPGWRKNGRTLDRIFRD